MTTALAQGEERLAKHREAAIEKAREKSLSLYRQNPEIEEIDKQLGDIAYEVFLSLSGGGDESAVKNKWLSLKERRDELLGRLGFPPDFDSPKFICGKCRDTGYIKLEKCSCLKSLEAVKVMEKTYLGKGLKNCRFSTFNPSLCTGQGMAEVFEFCRRYADGFGEDSENLLFFGGTGLGKTHLAAAIGHTAAEKGFPVVYESAQGVVSDCRKAMFTNESRADESYYGCTLLIIDDLGAEYKSDFSVSALTSLIDKRIVGGLPMIISTNLSLEELDARYEKRLFSRLLGNFVPVRFSGKDMRLLKIKLPEKA
ncbi:MAG: ATP-binding protein [Eubacteriales bacterium]